MAGQSHIPQQQAFKYNAFISYARAADDHLAPAVRSALHQFARPWYKLRALRVFLDKAGLPVSPGLSNAIEKALNESKWLLLMASPDAAESEWVRHEIDWWLKHRPCSHLLILLTAGDIVWDPVRNDFDWEHTTALPKTLSGRFADEPLYADLRKLKKTKHLSLRSLAFRDSIASIAATLHDRPKDELDGEDVILHRQFIRIRRIVVTAMSVLTIGVILLTGLSYLQRDRAIQNQINALVNSAGNALAANMQLEALIAGVTAGRLLEKMGRGLDGVIQSVIDSDSWAETHARTAARLHRVLSALHERNRLEGHSAKVNAIAYSPRCPNPAQFIVSGGKDGKVMIWKPNGILKKTLEHGDEVRSVAISPDCRIIASGGRDNTIKLWTRDGVLIEALPNDAWINTLSFDPDGQFLASGDESGQITLWTPDGEKLKTIGAHNRRILNVSFQQCPDGKQLLATVSASRDEPLKLWDLKQDFHPISSRHQHEASGGARINSVSISPDCSMMTTGNKDGTITLRKLDGSPYKTLQGHGGRVNSIGFSADGQRIVSGGESDLSDPARNGNTIKLWTRDGKAIASFEGHSKAVTGVRFSSHGKNIVSASGDNTIRIWNVDSVPVVETLGLDTARDARISPNGEIVAVVRDDNKIDLINLGTKATQTLLHEGSSRPEVVFRGDGSIFSFSTATHRLQALNQGKDIVLDDHIGKITSAALSPDGNTLATSNDYGITIRTSHGEPITSLDGYSKSNKTLSFSPDGQALVFLVSNSEQATLKLWRPNKTAIRFPAGHKQRINDVNFSPDGKTIASAGDDHLIKLWSLAGEELQTLIGHDSEVKNVTFDPKGKMLASSDFDGRVIVWSCNGQKLLTLNRDAKRNIWALKFSQDGRKLIAVSQDAITVWNLALNELLQHGCRSLNDYLKTNKNLAERDKDLCKKH